MSLSNIPVYTQSEIREKGISKEQAKVVVPDGAEAKKVLERLHPANRCIECKHFDLRKGQEEIRRQNLFQKLFKEMEHDPAWYGRVDLFGLCGQSHGQLMVHAYAPARVPRHYLDSDTAYEKKDENVPCPSFTPRGIKREKASEWLKEDI